MRKPRNVYCLQSFRHFRSDPRTRFLVTPSLVRLSEREVRERAARQAIVAVIDVETGEVRHG